MIRLRRTAAKPPVTIRPPFEERAKAVMARSISPASRTFIGRNSTPSDAATDWSTAKLPTLLIALMGDDLVAQVGDQRFEQQFHLRSVRGFDRSRLLTVAGVRHSSLLLHAR